MEQHRTEFKVVFDGIDLPADSRAAIEDAIRRAVADQVAQLDFHGDLAEQPLQGVGGGLVGLQYVPKADN